MNRITLAAFTLSAGSILFAPGCGPKKQPSHVPPENPASATMTDLNQRLSALQRRSTDLSSVARQLPGRDQQHDHSLVAEAFDRAAGALELLGGPEPGGAFRQQLRIMDSARQRLRNTAGKIDAPVDPTIDSGLRSLYNALTSVRERLFQDDDRIHQQLDVVRAQLDDLDTVRGPLHSVVVAKTFGASADVINTMADELQGREAAASGATMRPRTEVASPPTHLAPAPTAASTAGATASAEVAPVQPTPVPAPVPSPTPAPTPSPTPSPAPAPTPPTPSPSPSPSPSPAPSPTPPAPAPAPTPSPTPPPSPAPSPSPAPAPAPNPPPSVPSPSPAPVPTPQIR